MFRSTQYILATSVSAFLLLVDSYSNTYAEITCLLLILVLGIPHGAVDHKIHFSTSGSQANFWNYLIKYLLIAVGYSIWWILDPVKALFIFIILSSYHFGQELLEDRDIHGKSQSPLISLTWGLVILVAPIFFSASEVDRYLGIITDFSVGTIERPISLVIVVFIYSLALVHFLFISLTHRISGSNAKGLIFFLLFNTILHLILDFVLAFTIYFVFFHSLNAFRHQYCWLASKKIGYTLRKFLIDLSYFTLVAVAGLLVLLWIINPSNTSSLITIFFILVSLITLPHAMTLHQFYRVRRQVQEPDI